MPEYNVTFPEGDAVNPIQCAGHTVLRQVKKHCKWTGAEMIKFQLKFCMEPGTSIKKFFLANLVETSIPEKTFGTHWRLSGLNKLQDSDTPFEMAKAAIEHYVASLKKKATKRTIAASKSHR